MQGRELLLIVDALARLPLSPSPQPETGVTYAAKIEKAEALIDWRQPATTIDRQIRAFNPFPGAVTTLAGTQVKLWQATPVAATGAPGELLALERDSLVIACGEGALCVTELQKAGGKRLPVARFLAGHPLNVGEIFGAGA